MNVPFRRERGHCSVCGGSYAVTIEGRIGRHYPDSPPMVRLSALPRCAGSKTLSVEMQKRTAPQCDCGAEQNHGDNCVYERWLREKHNDPVWMAEMKRRGDKAEALMRDKASTTDGNQSPRESAKQEGA